MATAPYSRKLNLTRDQLAQFLTDQQQIRQFELLFSVADQAQYIPDEVNEAKLEAGSAQATANDALAQLTRLANAVELLAAAPVIENNNSTVTDYLDFNGAAPHVSRIRRMAWNDADQTVDLGMEYDVVQQIGLETYARVANFTGITIPNGTVVGFTGAVPDSALSVAPYLANGATNTLYIVGVMTHDLPDSGDKGYCTVWGFVRDVDTSAFILGDILYASPTVAGGLTKVKPTAPNNVVPIAAVLQVGTTDGVIFVRPTIEQQIYYGEFTKLNSQSPAATNTAYPLTFTNTEIANGVSIGGTTSQIIIAQAGLYNINCSVQITSTNSSQKSIWVWLRKNGTTDITNSARVASITLNNGYLVVTLNEVASLLAGDFIEVMYAADSTNVSIATVAATAFAPAAPAVILAVTQTEQ
tara:strand:+ start:301 stop:1542 length:1242 start_codon:yes stop_codon:yes gene_type:complete